MKTISKILLFVMEVVLHCVFYGIVLLIACFALLVFLCRAAVYLTEFIVMFVDIFVRLIMGAWRR